MNKMANFSFLTTSFFSLDIFTSEPAYIHCKEPLEGCFKLLKTFKGRYILLGFCKNNLGVPYYEPTIAVHDMFHIINILQCLFIEF